MEPGPQPVDATPMHQSAWKNLDADLRNRIVSSSLIHIAVCCRATASFHAGGGDERRRGRAAPADRDADRRGMGARLPAGGCQPHGALALHRSSQRGRSCSGGVRLQATALRYPCNRFVPLCYTSSSAPMPTGDLKLTIGDKWQKLEFDLRSFCETAARAFPVISIHLFGSRNFNTRSVRSDIDLFFETEEIIIPSEVRDFIDEKCKALDIFLLEHGVARSVINESFIRGNNNVDVLQQCGAIKLWSQGEGLVQDNSIPWTLWYASHVDFTKTILPNAHIRMSIDDLKARLQSEGLPHNPVIGETEIEVATRLIELAERITSFKRADFPNSSRAQDSFVVKPSSEYDFQDLFWIVSKPWIQSIAREKVEIVFDGQEKRSDFSVGGSRFIVEMKFAKNRNDKRNIARTLEGLSKFYSENANVRFLIYMVYARRDADIDPVQWETTFSRIAGSPKVLVKVITLDD